MQANTKITSSLKDSTTPAHFSSYLSSTGTAVQHRSYKTNSPSSDNSWDNRDNLPPPPSSYQDELVIQAKSVPIGPAKSWTLSGSDDDDDLSDEGVDKAMMEDLEDSGSDCHDTESECTTEIYIPKPNTMNKTITHHHRTGTTHKPLLHTAPYRVTGCEVIPSVSNDNLWMTSPTNLHKDALTEEIATNIDSGISNETSHVQSQDSATVKHRTMSVSSSSHYSSSYSCGSRGEIPSPKFGHQTRIDDIALYMKEAKVSRVVSFLSAAYALLLILLGVICSLYKQQYSYSFEGFYMYLYGLGILFLIYVYTTVIRAARRPPSPQIVHRTGTLVSHDRTLYHNDTIHPVGNLFLRVSAVLFCAGSLMDNGLMLGVSLDMTCASQLITTVQPLLQAAFLLLQIYFVFNNSKMRVRDYPIVAKFGLMHLIASNITIWITRTMSIANNDALGIVLPLQQPKSRSNMNETYKYSDTDDSGSFATDLDLIWKAETTNNCTQSQWLSNMVYKAKPYVYPCTIQFCALACCILFVVWRKVDRNSDTQCNDCKENSKRNNHSDKRTIDCGSTSRGLFLGILVLVTAIASLIAFFMLTTDNYMDIRATLVIHIYYIAVYLLMTTISVVVLLKLAALDYNSCRTTLLEDILAVLCLIALTTYDLLGILSAVQSLNKMKALLVLASSVAELIQSVVQMAAMIMGLKLCTPDHHVEIVNRPGRECVTFLAVTNIALWLLSIFSNILCQYYDIQVAFVGEVTWYYVINIVNPIVILYHLFSASCFIDIWYNAYRMPSSPIAHL